MLCFIYIMIWFKCYCYCLTEDGILQDTDRTEQAVMKLDAPGIVNNTSSIARRAHRILQVAKSEADNSEDPQFVERVNDTINDLRNSKPQPLSQKQTLASHTSYCIMVLLLACTHEISSCLFSRMSLLANVQRV